jgi:hypothetical protein
VVASAPDRFRRHADRFAVTTVTADVGATRLGDAVAATSDRGFCPRPAAGQRPDGAPGS